MTKMERYLPEILRNIREFGEITGAEEPIFEKHQEAIHQMLKDQFVMSAGDMGLKRYERMLGIAGGSGDAPEDRRFRILAKINNRLPYSMGWLRGKLDALFGAENYTLERDAAAHKLVVETDVQFESVILDLYADLRKSIPASMILETYISSSLPLSLYTGCTMQTMSDVYL